MIPVPRKRCPNCRTVFEGAEVERTYSCDVCGSGHLTDLPPSDSTRPGAPEPRSGGSTITHTRDNF